MSVGWGFEVEPLGPDRCRLVTCTRTRPADEVSRRRLRAYWTVIGPVAGLARRLTLRCIRAAAEQHATTARAGYVD